MKITKEMLEETFDFEEYYVNFIRDKKYYRIKNLIVNFIMGALNEGLYGYRTRDYFRFISGKFGAITRKLLKNNTIKIHQDANTKVYEVLKNG